MILRFVLPLAASIALLVAAACTTTPEPGPGRWRAWLDSPGGELPFELELSRRGDDWHAVVMNGRERIDLPDLAVEDGSFRLLVPHYDAEIEAAVRDGGERLEGRWSKRSGPGAWSRLDFHAVRGGRPRFSPLDRSGGRELAAGAGVAGRWSVRFSGSDEPAVAVFESGEGDDVTGTFMTTTGDYRYLAGRFEAGRLRLSVFDGAHAFLFQARLADDGTLHGDFWSRDSWHETWVARRDPDAALPDPFSLTTWVGGTRLGDLVFRALDGEERSLRELHRAGRPMIIELFGSWCPNCHDAASFLADLDRRYRGQGLSIVGLAFEITGDHERDAEQVRRYAERHGLEFPLLVAGLSDKDEASASFPAVDRVRAYPTMIFVDGAGEVSGVHTGFSGPATGEAHARQTARLEGLVERLLAGTAASAAWSAPAHHP